MSKLIALIKYSFINCYGLNKSKKSVTSNILFWIFTGFTVMVTAFVMFYEVVATIIEFGLPPQIFLVSILTMITGIIVVMDMIRSTGTIFNVKDFQLLATLPISGGKLILAKIMDVLLTNYIITVVIMIPAYLVYFTVIGFDVKLLILLVICAIFVPFIPMSIGILLGYILYRVSSKFKYKEMAITGLYILCTVALFIFVYSAPKFMPYILEKADYIITILSKLYLPIQFYTQMLLELSFMNLLYFAVSSLIVFAILMIIIRNSFFKLNSRFTVYGKSSDTKLKEGKRQGKIISLFKTEFLKYISKGVVVLNTGIGGIVYILFVVLDSFGILELNGIGGGSAVLIMGCIMFAISPITATSISLEGKAFNMKKSLPIKPMDILISKILLNIIVNIPFVIVGGLLTLIIGNATVLAMLADIGTIVVALVFASIFGLLINLKFYDFDWNSEAVVVKRSKSVVITMIPNMLIMFLFMGMQISNVNASFLVIAIYALLFLISSVILVLKGEKWYNDINVG